MKLPKSYRIFNRNIIKTKNLWLVSVKKKNKTKLPNTGPIQCFPV
uniref:Uncharacterized protein n=1 Tax=Brassica campestris TaxID=3711 RepID=A0A3P6BQR5_BRACM|nr:unnamed protein product [Brassica rapa]